MAKIMRFYGSCGHIVDRISDKSFDQFAAPRTQMGWSGKLETYTNEVTKEDGNEIVHVHPDRYFACSNCIDEHMREH